MEIDLSACKVQKRSGLVVIAILISLVGLGLLGWYITPDGKVLTWTEWQVYKQHIAYQQGLRILTRDSDRLATLLAAPPDPVRAQLEVEQVYSDLDGIELVALQEQVYALSSAADEIVLWALGMSDPQIAIYLLDEANQALAKAIAVTQEINSEVHK
jgi:hypothetical protein